MNGLLIREPWIEMILNGLKVWEIRGRNTNIRGKIALIRSGSGLIVGTTELVQSIPITLEEFASHFDFHRVPSTTHITYSTPHAWVFTNTQRLSKPVPYIHPPGAVRWVNLSKQKIIV
ncbi:ASCH domain-containing protein [Paenibacillus sp. Leaf72]|uniref:ASCH domain-containing protein n=1 Tax=Paenibacillus sp. Leaf72 TaxID=1736234 RepID=UPI0006F6CA21|nr:ASCH domain-containing protein [Paenibacillus sp. Leaf72]KQN97006.1 hypothetical protein ASF12_23340 [Paenibacillus sp. Leaf72]